MIKLKQVILSDSGIQKIWEIFSNINNWPKINPVFKYAKPIGNFKWKAGHHFEFFSDYGIIKSKSVCTIIECNPKKSVTWVGSKKFIIGKHSLFFKKVKNNIEVTNYEEFTGIGAYLLNFGLKSKIDKSLKLFLEGLKREAEK